ncbi:MAG: YihY/virulence factor BrkB family protein [Acidobacteriota bacterium]|nr:YihY/virulence factor BrkB family protein [Acidobacteriota bacterium]
MFKSLSLGGLSLKELGGRVYKETTEDGILGYAAQLSYYFLLALFPALLFMTSLLGYFAGEDSQLRAGLFRYLGAVLPGDASQLIAKTVNDVTQGSGGGKLSFGILATLWAASNGMTAISESLNAAYDLKETRPWWKVRLVAIGLTLALSFLIISSLVLVLYGHDLADTVAVKFGLGAAFALTWKIVQWPIVLAFVLLGFALIYYFAPDARDQDWKWITPGSVAGVALWLLVSFAFKTYLTFFNSYSATYGSLGAVIILMLWFYFTGAAILVGGEINSEIENAMAKRGAPDAKEKGEKRPGDRGRSNAGGEEPRRQRTSDSRSKASDSSTKERPRTHATHGRVTRMDAHEERFSLGKFAVVMGAWALSKVGLSRTERKTE